MISPAEVYASALANAKPMSLMLPRGSHEETIIISGTEQERWAVFIRAEYQCAYTGFIIRDNWAWRGALVNNIIIELDETSLFDSSSIGVPLGAVVRYGDRLSMSVRPDGEHRSRLVPIQAGLSFTENGDQVGFYKWHIAVGAGSEKRVLKSIDVTPPNYVSPKF